jgi:predicted DNA-binding transcriptional regulator YafY
VRTLHRDVDQLSAAGVPIYAERGRAGGFQLLEGWQTRLTGLTPAEAQAVFLSGLAGPAAELGLQAPLQDAQLKLLSSLPESWRADAQKVQARFHLDPVDWYREAAPTPQLATVAEAVWNERQLEMRYESWDGEVARVVSPLGLVLKAGTWYFVGAVGNDVRTYRISNLRHAAPLEARAKRPRQFELARYWADSVRRFESELYRGEARCWPAPPGSRACAPRARRSRGRPRRPRRRAARTAASRCASRSNRSSRRPASCCGSRPTSR